MQAKKKLCSGCNQMKFIFTNAKGNRYCKYCWQKANSSTQSLNDKTPKRKPIAQRSKKRIKEDSVYKKLRADYLERNPTCEVNHPSCSHQATDIHHSYAGANRSKYYLITTTWFAVCRECHNWIHFIDPKRAREEGYLK